MTRKVLLTAAVGQELLLHVHDVVGPGVVDHPKYLLNVNVVDIVWVEPSLLH